MTTVGSSDRFRVLGERWVATTMKAHRLLEKLPACSAEPMALEELEARLRDQSGEASTKFALELLIRGKWAAKHPRRDRYYRTAEGDLHLCAIQDEQRLIDAEFHRWLVNHGIPQDHAEKVGEEIRGVIHQNFAPLVRLSPGVNVAFLLQSLVAAPSRVSDNHRRIFQQAATDVEQGKTCPLASIICREALETVFKEFYENVPSDTPVEIPLHILLDTNVFIPLICPAAREHSRFLMILDRLAAARPVTLYVTSATMQEVRAHLYKGDAEVEALMATVPFPKADNLSRSARIPLGPFVRQYAAQYAGQIPYAIYADQEYLWLWHLLARGPRALGSEEGLGRSFRLPGNEVPRLFAFGVGLLETRGDFEPDLSGLSTEGYERATWPTFSQTLRWMSRTKPNAIARHDAILCQLAILRRQQDKQAHWVVWTNDTRLLEYEGTELKLARPGKRIFRSPRMMQALWLDRPNPSDVLTEAMQELTDLTAWSAGGNDMLERTTAAMELFYATGQSGLAREKYVDLLQRASGDPYGALRALAIGEIEEAAEEGSEPPRPLPSPWRTEPPTTLPKLPVGSPDATEYQPFPAHRALPDAEKRVVDLVLLEGPGRFLELSGDWSTYVAAHGPLPATFGLRTPVAGGDTPLLSYPEFEVSVHSVAHFDLCWAIVPDAEELRDYDSRPDPNSVEAKALHHRIIRPQELPAVVIDLRYKAAALFGRIEEISEGHGDWVLSAEGSRNIKQVLRDLWIRKDELQQRLCSSGDPVSLRHRWLVLHTGWPELFRPRAWPDISNRGYECWHTWNLHPYIDLECARWLVEQDIYGLATDTAMIDCPAYLLQMVPGIFGDVLAAQELIGRSGAGEFPGPELPAYQPAHAALLLSQRPMLESISIPSAPLEEAAAEYRARGEFETTLFTMGLGMPQMVDGALAKVFLRLSHGN